MDNQIKASKWNKASGHAACFLAYAIFGLNIVICKDLTGSHTFSPLALFSIRSVCACALFWLVSLFFPRERVEARDFVKIFLASFLGYFCCQLSFLMAIPQVTPMTSSIVSSLSPVYTMFIAAVAIKEPLTLKKAAGVLVSFGGMLLLVLGSMNASGVQENTIQGILLLIVNGLSFALYLGIFKPLISKYSVCTFMKWIFLFSTLMSLPFTVGELIHLDWCAIPSEILLELAFLVFFATFVSYYLIPYGQKQLRPTLVSMYAYVQPIIATAISICIGMDRLSWQKILSALLVFAGVIIVSRSKRRLADMKELIGYCGLDCEQCDARRATINNDNELRARTARLWCEWNNTDQIKPEHINCLGCRVEGVKTVYCSYMCEVRKCCISRSCDTCADCSEKAGCEKLAPFMDNEVARKNIGIE